MTTSPIQLIIGLANPGAEYAKTRHNAGAWFVECLANEAKKTLRFEAKFKGLYSKLKLETTDCHVLIPTTFMNHSGQAVKACMHYHKFSPTQILIVHDDIDLPVGAVKLKFDGGDGGHNGLKDVISHLTTKKFYRLRIGVGRPRPGKDVVDYVLTQPSKTERHAIDASLKAALDIVPLLLQGEMQRAMQLLHTSPGEEK